MKREILPTELVRDHATFSTLRAECDEVFFADGRLPQPVFRHRGLKFAIIEYAYIFRKEFVAMLAALAHSFGDERVHYMTLLPDPAQYFKDYSFYGAATFLPQMLDQRYLSVMSRDGDVASFKSRGGDVGVLWGSALKWGIMCDRISWEVAVIGVPENANIPKANDIHFMNAERLTAYMKSQYPHRTEYAADTAKEFLANYPI